MPIDLCASKCMPPMDFFQKTGLNFLQLDFLYQVNIPNQILWGCVSGFFLIVSMFGVQLADAVINVFEEGIHCSLDM